MEAEPYVSGDPLPSNRLSAKTEEEPPSSLTPSLSAPVLTQKKTALPFLHQGHADTVGSFVCEDFLKNHYCITGSMEHPLVDS